MLQAELRQPDVNGAEKQAPAGMPAFSAERTQALTDAFLPGHWFLEFNQDYGDGTRVCKRGLDASPMVIRKYKMTGDEALAFSTYDGRHRAMTVFHFHPDFADERRRHYMEAHRDGYDVAHDVGHHLAEQQASRRAALTARLAKAGRAVTVAAHAVAVFLLAHYSPGR